MCTPSGWGFSVRRRTIRCSAGVVVALAGGTAACSNALIPEFNAPTSVSATPTGIQNAVIGVINTSRFDVFNYITYVYGFARDATQFQSTEGGYDSELLGQSPISNADFIGFTLWDFEFRDARTVNDMIAILPKVTPAYTPQQIATLTGVGQTLKAMNFMWVAETHDTLGVPVAGVANPTSNAPAPLLCNKDVWQYIVSLLDSGNADLLVDSTTPMPVILPPGFSVVSATAGSFRAFNRALAGKAGLELAYAISRAPDSTSVGVTDPAAQAALLRADSAIQASALYNPGALIAGGLNEPNGVYFDFSGASGDQPNPINTSLTTLYFLVDFAPDFDTTDARVKTKFAPNPNQVGQPNYANLVMNPPTLYNGYPNVNSSIPIIRNEELVLLRAQIHIAQHDWATAMQMINAVRTTVGGEPAYGALASYVPVREALLHEQRLSTTYEMGGDRLLSLRWYSLVRSRLHDFSNDLQTTVLPIPQGEDAARNHNLTPVCP